MRIWEFKTSAITAKKRLPYMWDKNCRNKYTTYCWRFKSSASTTANKNHHIYKKKIVRTKIKSTIEDLHFWTLV